MNRSRFLSVFLVALFISFALACQKPAPEPPDTRAADEAAIRAQVKLWLEAVQAKDVEKSVSFYADDGALLPPGVPLASGKEAIRQTWAQLMNMPGFSLKFASTKIEVARSGDIAYEVGTFELAANDAKGKPQTTKGKYVVVWKKQAGSWKAAADIFNADQ